MLKDPSIELRGLVCDAMRDSPFYADHYARHGISETDLQRPRFFGRLPIVSQQDLIAGCHAVRNHAVQPYRVTCSSGTSNHPKVLFRTREDTRRSVEVMTRLFHMAGLQAGDSVWVGQPFDMAHIGFLALEACEALGLLCLPAGLGLPDGRVVELLDVLRPTAIFSAPSRVAQICRAYAGRAERPPVRTILLAGEPCNPRQAAEFATFWNARVANLYGSEETDGLAGSCGAVDHLHFMDDMFLLELVRPGTSQLVESGPGEAVITARHLRGTPLIRYRLGDVLEPLDGPCACGAKWPLVRVLGRANATFHLYDGVSLHDYQLRSAMVKLGVTRFQAILRTDPDGVDEIELRVDPAVAGAADLPAIESGLLGCSLDLLASVEMQKLRVAARWSESFHRTDRGKHPELVNLRERRA